MGNAAAVAAADETQHCRQGEHGVCFSWQRRRYLPVSGAEAGEPPTFRATASAALPVALAPRATPLAAACAPRCTPLAAALTPRCTPLAAALAPRSMAFSTL